MSKMSFEEAIEESQTQSLKLSDEMFPAVVDGKKTVTIRKGERNITKGALLLLPTNETCKGEMVFVSKVLKCPFREIPADMMQQDFGFMSHADALQEMRRFYPDLTEDDMMTVVEWEGVMKPYIVFEKVEWVNEQPEISSPLEENTGPYPRTTIAFKTLIEREDGFYNRHEQKYERYQIRSFFNSETGNFENWPEYDEERCMKDAK